uniref:MSP domain-containing protein n=1 Tax=Haemonchus contortus TaxID=6289 RepID=A0A7I4YHE2_HAECO
MEPKFGILAPRESCELNITRETNQAERKIAHDRVGIEWIKAPADKPKDEMCEDWFDDAKIIHRKNFSITDQ